MLNVWRRIFVTTAIWAVASFTFVGGEKAPEPAKHASQYPAHETHALEKVSVGVEPFDDQARSSIFVVDYNRYKVLPIRVVISNDSDQPIQLLNLKLELIPVGDGKDHWAPATWADVRRKVGRELSKTPTDNSPVGGPMGLPLPSSSKKRDKGISAKEQFEELLFAAKAVEPHGSQSGFVFFDIGDAPMPPRKAKLYLTGIRNAANQELFYFELPLYPNARTIAEY